ncbi:MAG: TIGR03936 family radical SAM-associated protein [Dehalococcoidia bacterium]|nr:TIGR03936 family radical SAM-associated protein [Dehalococcoidia bacterium]
MQRLRLRFGRGDEVKFISHLDVVRFWERAFRRAKIPLVYSQGFTPHPRISLAAPLAVGVTSEAELMDVWLSRWMPPQSLTMRVKSQLPCGFEIFDAWQVGLNIPSLQSCLAFAEYRVVIKSGKSKPDVEASLHSLLQARELPWHHSRGDKMKLYDLRALIEDLWVIGHHLEPFVTCYSEGEKRPKNLAQGRLHEGAICILGMRLRCDAKGSGRPEQVVVALGFPQYPESIHRTKLILKGMSP